MIHSAGLPLSFWAEAVNTAVYLRNRSPMSSLKDSTPYEYWHNEKPDISHLNPITYGGGGFLARTVRLSSTTLKRLYLAPPNLVTFCFYLLETFWQNFSNID